MIFKTIPINVQIVEHLLGQMLDFIYNYRMHYGEYTHVDMVFLS